VRDRTKRRETLTRPPPGGVPGELRGLEYLHKHYGRLPWADVMAPAIRVARHGFRVTEDLVSYMAAATAGSVDFLTTDPT
jgi:gamma-glutamyltranspeptidase/glutathione hydrolase